MLGVYSLLDPRILTGDSAVYTADGGLMGPAMTLV